MAAASDTDNGRRLDLNDGYELVSGLGSVVKINAYEVVDVTSPGHLAEGEDTSSIGATGEEHLKRTSSVSMSDIRNKCDGAFLANVDGNSYNDEGATKSVSTTLRSPQIKITLKGFRKKMVRWSRHFNLNKFNLDNFPTRSPFLPRKAFAGGNELGNDPCPDVVSGSREFEVRASCSSDQGYDLLESQFKVLNSQLHGSDNLTSTARCKGAKERCSDDGYDLLGEVVKDDPGQASDAADTTQRSKSSSIRATLVNVGQKIAEWNSLTNHSE